MGIVIGPIRRGDGIAPAVALIDPKFPHNVGAAVRAASCYGVRQVWFIGDRVRLDGAKRQRLPREERMRGYQDVEVRHADQFFDAFEDAVPVAVELRRNAESLIDFVHPEHALYVFGPEDGSLGRATLAQCHRFLVIPTRHCANLSAAVYTVLYDRHAKRVHDGLELPHSTQGTSMSLTTWPTPSESPGRLARRPKPTLQGATGHTGPGTSDSPIMTNWLSCRWRY
jgi:tRNA(Leu) C34 or U34 (ribose-2'-O)-methylase TrmL